MPDQPVDRMNPSERGKVEQLRYWICFWPLSSRAVGARGGLSGQRVAIDPGKVRKIRAGLRLCVEVLARQRLP